jgi:hypothetical protein
VAKSILDDAEINQAEWHDDDWMDTIPIMLPTPDQFIAKILASDPNDANGGFIIRAFIEKGIIVKGPDDRWVLTEEGRVALDTVKRPRLH